MLAVDFIQGVAFVDVNNDNQYDAGDTPKVNATIQLQNTSTNVTVSTTTNTDGYYRFDGVAPGNYRLTELPNPGFNTSGSQITSLFDSGVWNIDHIDVSVPNPALTLPVKVDRVPGVAGGFTSVNTAYTLTAPTPPAANSFTQTPDTTNAHQFQVRLLSSTSAPLTPYFYTYCMDLYHIAPGFHGPYDVLPSSTPQNLPPAVTTNLGEIGWLYNHFGKNLATSGADGAGAATGPLRADLRLDHRPQRRQLQAEPRERSGGSRGRAELPDDGGWP